MVAIVAAARGRTAEATSVHRRDRAGGCGRCRLWQFPGAAAGQADPGGHHGASPGRRLPVRQQRGGTRSAALPSQAIPAGFAPVAVVRCNPVTVFLNHNRVRMRQVRQVATADLGTLMAALRARSAPANSNVVCPVQLIAIAWFVLIGKNGQVVLPNIPVTVCGDPSPAALASLGALGWRNLP
jgi:hypothetical protein